MVNTAFVIHLKKENSHEKNDVPAVVGCVLGNGVECV
ncbi:hypothetical protein Enr17x_46360 [Gimesia fumaroli]|jgi:hypothetical protein|uniref:Uncharacterized protein n=1 Tax=Gimesia fumaroli TaxID=2527976 RepID=A0A518IHK2_9PLAN|nr:hypothetical protein Enr17x_46360 [Gimesia fumaroli]